MSFSHKLFHLLYSFSIKIKLHISDIKGFSGLHKLINGIPYDAPDHQGWTAVRRYIKYKEDAGTIAQELEEYQNKTTPMLMAACECLAQNILIQITNFHRFESFLTHAFHILPPTDWGIQVANHLLI